MRKILFPLLLIFPAVSQAQGLNGFDLSKASIPVSEILPGGPPKDGIPAIDKPKFAPANKVHFLKDDDKVFGVSFGKDRRAYPLRILVFHEIVNDIVGGQSVADATYNPVTREVRVTDKSGKVLPVVQVFWFAWQGFYPQTILWNG